ncbi:hypothetical protein [Aliivibrio fischeri]|uniref:hypothetical protein n=1 Tax=Aliivibrio fischeri TaxID=668 RepID=UPI001111D168|nr:hypothetical protein [Aliivibrio fischeri]
MIIIEEKRVLLENSLALYRFAIINGYASELPFLSGRIKENQDAFERVYKKECEFYSNFNEDYY